MRITFATKHEVVVHTSGPCPRRCSTQCTLSCLHRELAARRAANDSRPGSSWQHVVYSSHSSAGTAEERRAHDVLSAVCETLLILRAGALEARRRVPSHLAPYHMALLRTVARGHVRMAAMSADPCKKKNGAHISLRPRNTPAVLVEEHHSRPCRPNVVPPAPPARDLHLAGRAALVFPYNYSD